MHKRTFQKQEAHEESLEMSPIYSNRIEDDDVSMSCDEDSPSKEDDNFRCEYWTFFLCVKLFSIAKQNILSAKSSCTTTPLIKHIAKNVIKHFTLITNW